MSSFLSAPYEGLDFFPLNHSRSSTRSGLAPNYNSWPLLTVLLPSLPAAGDSSFIVLCSCVCVENQFALKLVVLVIIVLLVLVPPTGDQ